MPNESMYVNLTPINLDGEDLSTDEISTIDGLEEFHNDEDLDIKDNQEREDDLITSFLKSKGIKDPSAIKQLDDQGNVQEVDFNTLSREEQLNILGSSDLDNNYGLDDKETEFISLLRDNNLTVDDYLNYVRNKAVEDYIADNSQSNYSVNDITDDELYLLDLKYNFPDITEDEAKQYLDHDKSNESLWEKKIKVLRDNYISKENEKLEEQKLIAEEQVKAEQQNYVNSIVEAINDLKTIESFDLEEEDKERLTEFILGNDATGTNYLYRALQDPVNIAKMAWFLLDGSDSIKALNDYWTNVVKQHSQNKYNEGYQDALNGKKSKVVKTSRPEKNTNNTKFISLGDSDSILDLD